MYEAQFKKIFEPYGDGYVIYPSYRKGGKFITVAERDALMADFRRKFRPVVLLGLALLAGLSGILWSELSRSLDFPFDMDWIRFSTMGLLVGAWMIWIFSPPARLVHGRPDVVPPRSKAEWRQLEVKRTAWWHIAVILGGGIAALYVASTLPEGSIERLLLIGGGCLILLVDTVYAIRKWRLAPA